ncbi:hypothetical protein SAMN02745127_02960 [Oceanospirillum multiglobuliferum]|uniref:TIGR02449 family protein n=1 Tax=Oceanospirillum multiglobuliferum TaxID=64969 RepID=A0A1T4SDJ1_9GAMM|nr:hypothetical protein [Oceanospirillum multiglobuliferum]OPX54331.1 hypothetical protein BTE48_14840 [Oceanospirillum multiglobuliferum]SKA26245.1 hypothetical protein SAMN02745127_02960 [Oceanospirillum multiglobuliferum]
MDTDALNLLEEQLHELCLLCLELRQQNHALKKQVLSQSEQIASLTQKEQQIGQKVGTLLSRLGATESDHE